jgi:predicted transglutaminase-like cysteine proteinase
MMLTAKISAAILGAAMLLSVGSAIAAPANMRITGPTAPPMGHVEFCTNYADDCLRFEKPDQVVRLTSSTWDHLKQMNQAINRAVMPATDMEIFGTIERWEYPSYVGDCEDYVLEKRRQLVRAGWPDSALLITVVRDEFGEGHAVLTVRTDRGDLVLDNKTDEIVVWDMAPYQFVKRQSTRHAANWDALEDHRTAAVGSLR